MSFDPVAALFDSVSELRASAQMKHRRQPRVRIEWDCEAGTHTMTIVVDGQAVVSASAASLEQAARRAYGMFEAWQADSPEGLADALTTSLELARAGGLR